MSWKQVVTCRRCHQETQIYDTYHKPMCEHCGMQAKSWLFVKLVDRHWRLDTAKRKATKKEVE